MTDDDPNEAYEVVPIEAGPHGPPKGWWTVKDRRRRGNEAEQTANPDDSLKIGSGCDGYGDIKIVEC